MRADSIRIRRASSLLVTLFCSDVGTRAASFVAVPVPAKLLPASSPEFYRGMARDDDFGVAQTPAIAMDDILKGSRSAASAAVSMLTEARGTGDGAIDRYLEDALPLEIESFPLWARLPLCRYSRRARMLRLSRLLDMSTPDTAEDEDDEESKKRRARRSLFILLRSIADNPDYEGISPMLAMAKKEAKVGNLSTQEMLKRTPDLETPRYQILAKRKGGMEVRRYEKIAVCSVIKGEMKPKGTDEESASKLSNPQLSGATSFGALAGYLFGKNEERTAMKMTTPVLTEGEGSDRKMSFVLPSDFWEEAETAPKPLADSAVEVSSMDGCDRAVLAFGGFGRKGDVDIMSKRLQKMLEFDKEWRAIENDTITLAQYNDPFTPPWKRRNEVSILVEQS